MEFVDYYQVLGVARTATRAEIKRAYRAAARAYHPDARPVDPAAAQRFRSANEAHAVLADPAKRQRYDAMGPGWEPGPRPGFAPRPPFARRSGRHPHPADDANARTRDPGNARDEEPDDPSEFFRAFFGTAGPFGPASPFGGTAQGVQGETGPLEVTVELSLEGAYAGATRIAQIGGRRVRLVIPRGIESGSRICVPGVLGQRDLVVTCFVHPHPIFARQGADLARELPLGLFQALEGARVAVSKPHGQVLLSIPPGTRDGTEFILAGHGMPRLGGAGAGDLRVRVAVARPATLSPEEREAAAALLGRET